MSPTPISAPRLLTLALLAVLAAAAAACGGAEPEPPPQPLPVPGPTRGYLLLSIDTLRADHLGVYGYSRDTSPFLDRLAERGTVFEHAFVQLPGTLPSHMSIFTGLYPAEHGVYPPSAVLSEDIETLPEAFRRSGFRTAGFTEGGYVSGRYGFSRGFESFDDDVEGRNTDVEITLDRGLEFLRSLGPEERFFLFLHTYVVHDPYKPPAAYASLFHDGPPPPGAFEPTGPALTEVNRGTRTVTPEVVRWLAALYDAEIRYLDDVLEGFFADLDALGLTDETTVIITSDHGEEFFDHGKLVHEQIYPENLHVPLMILHPARPGPARVRSVTQSIDLAPTLLELAGIEPAGRISGHSLAPYLENPALELGNQAYAEAFGKPHRTLLRQTPQALYQLLSFRRNETTGRTVWISRSVTFDSWTSKLGFRARSFHQPRPMEVRADGVPVTRLELETRFKPFTVELPPKPPGPKPSEPRGAGPEKHVVTLSSPDCDVPRDLGLSSDPRCLSFEIRGMPLHHTELYDLTADPAATRDLSSELGGLHRELYQTLRAMTFSPRAQSRQEDLDADLERRLRALGYLQ
jgi:arylsulfatase A-like enzyme